MVMSAPVEGGAPHTRTRKCTYTHTHTQTHTYAHALTHARTYIHAKLENGCFKVRVFGMREKKVLLGAIGQPPLFHSDFVPV
jgi:hypothetical protein